MKTCLQHVVKGKEDCALFIYDKKNVLMSLVHHLSHKFPPIDCINQWMSLLWKS